MPTISRNSKSAGGTSFVDGTVIEADEVNADFDTVYNLVNGGLDDDNVTGNGFTGASLSSSATVEQTQINDISATDGAHDDTTTPGDSSSHTKPTSLQGEVQQLRYVVERLILGLAADRVDGTGTGTTFWGDLPARGPNLIKNPNFAGGTAATNVPPTGWSDLGTGSPTFSTVALSGATLTEGKGRELRIEAGAAAAAGVTQSLAGLKASTRYLVVARARSTSGTVHLKTTGADATSFFRNINDSSSSTTYVTLKGVIQTDSTPTAIVVQLTAQGNADTNDVSFAFCGVYECAADHVRVSGSPWVIASTSTTIALGTARVSPIGSQSVTINVPGPGFQIEVESEIPLTRDAANGTVGIDMMENVDGGGATGVSYAEVELEAATSARHVFQKFVRQAPVPGSTYVYTLEAEADGSTANVNGASNGAATIAGSTGVTRAELRARLIRVSE